MWSAQLRPLGRERALRGTSIPAASIAAPSSSTPPRRFPRSCGTLSSSLRRVHASPRARQTGRLEMLHRALTHLTTFPAHAGAVSARPFRTRRFPPRETPTATQPPHSSDLDQGPRFRPPNLRRSCLQAAPSSFVCPQAIRTAPVDGLVSLRLLQAYAGHPHTVRTRHSSTVSVSPLTQESRSG